MTEIENGDKTKWLTEKAPVTLQVRTEKIVEVEDDRGGEYQHSNEAKPFTAHKV